MMTNYTDYQRIKPMDPDFKPKMINTTGTEFFFINTAYLDAYIQLLEGIRQHRGLLLLTGEAGVGKTSLLRKLANESPAKNKFVYSYTTNLDFDNLLAVIGDQLGLITKEGEFPNRLEALNHYLNNCFKQGVDVAFLIDDAHHLNTNALEGLLALSFHGVEGRRTVQLVLSGTPLLEEILTNRQVFHTYLAGAVHVRLKPLTTVDVAAFISRQVQNADGPAVDSLFPSPVIARINHYTRGIPRLINLLCERALSITQIKGETMVSVATIDEAAGELILKEKEIASSPATDVLSLETAPTVSQVVKMEQWLAQKENLLGEETQTLIVGPLGMDRPQEYPSLVTQWNDRESGIKRSSPLRSSGLQIVILMLLALLAGLVGGMGSVYWHQRTAATVQPRLPASPAPAPAMTAGVTAPSGKLESQATAGLAPVSSSSSPEIAAKPEAIAPPKPLESSPAPPAGAAPTPPAEWIDSPTVSPPPAAAISPEAPLVSSYLMNGNLLFERGDIASARLFFQEAANAGSVQAMVAVGKTYDPNILSQLGIRGFSPDPVKAAEWYVKANQAGDSESAELLKELKRWLSDSPVLEEIEANTPR